MNKQEFYQKIRQFDMGDWHIVTQAYTGEPLVLGYYYDERDNSWKVYQNDEHSETNMQSFRSEEEALEELYYAAQVQQTLEFYYRDIHEIENTIHPVQNSADYPSAPVNR